MHEGSNIQEGTLLHEDNFSERYIFAKDKKKKVVKKIRQINYLPRVRVRCNIDSKNKK